MHTPARSRRFSVSIAALLALATTAFSQGYVCAEGGGNPGKGSWADEVFGWMVEKGQRGPVVIIGAIPLDSDERPALFTRLGASSVASLVVDQSNADAQATYDAIAAAKVIFIRGGDQSRYVNWWAGTKTQQAIKDVYAKGGVIAGTSAGCAVLGEITYDAKHGGLSPVDILHDARHPDLTLTPDFLGFTKGVLYDTHFTERGRLPRLAVMLAACAIDLKREIVGLGVDPRTAVCVGPDGVAEIRGEGTVTMLRIGEETVANLDAGKPPSVIHMDYAQWPAGYRVDLSRWEIVARPDYVRHIPAGTSIRPNYGEFTPVTINGGVEPGSVGEDAGEAVRYLADVSVIRRTWTGKHITQAMRAGQMWVCNDPGSKAFYIDEGATLSVDAAFKLLIGCRGDKPTSVVLLQGKGMTWAGISPTEQPAIEGASIDITPACDPAPK